jgi:magnesium transporter
VDVPVRDDESADLLTKHFDRRPRAAVDRANRNPVPKVHVYPEHATAETDSSTRSSRT